MSHNKSSRKEQQQQDLASMHMTPWEAMVPIQANGAAETVAALVGQPRIKGDGSTSTSGSIHEKYEFFIYTKFTPNLQARDAVIKQEAPDVDEVAFQPDPHPGATSPISGLGNSARKPVPLGGGTGRMAGRGNSATAGGLPTVKVQKIKAKANEACISQATVDFILVCLNTAEGTTDGGADESGRQSSSTKKSSSGTTSRTDPKRGSSSVTSNPLSKGTQSFTLWRVTSSMDNLRRLDMDWSLCARMVEQVFRRGDTSKMTINMSASPASKLVKLDVKLGGPGARIHYPVVELNLSLMETKVANDALLPPSNMDNPIVISPAGDTAAAQDKAEDDLILDPLAHIGGAFAGPLVDPHRFLFHKVAGLLRRLSRETQDQQDCRRQLDKMKEEMESSNRQHLELEEELMVAFLEVLNAKKQKIREVTAIAQDFQARNQQLEEENKKLHEELNRRPLLTTTAAGGNKNTSATAGGESTTLLFDEQPSQKKTTGSGNRASSGDNPALLLREATAADLLEQAEEEEFGDSDRGEDDQPRLFGGDNPVEGLQGLSSTQMQEQLDGEVTNWGNQSTMNLVGAGDDNNNGVGGGGLFGPGGIDEYLNPASSRRTAAPNDALGGRTKRGRGDVADQAGQQGDGNDSNTSKKKKLGGIDLLNMDI